MKGSDRSHSHEKTVPPAEVIGPGGGQRRPVYVDLMNWVEATHSAVISSVIPTPPRNCGKEEGPIQIQGAVCAQACEFMGIKFELRARNLSGGKGETLAAAQQKVRRLLRTYYP